MTTTSPPRLESANADFVTPQLIVGGDLDVFDNLLAVDQLRELLDTAQLTHVVDAREECNDESFVTGLAPGLGYLWHGVDDAGQRMPGAWFDAGVDYVMRALRDPDAVVLVHCHMGINRGPSLGYAVLLALGWDPVEAIDRIRAVRPIANVGYAEDALRWHHERQDVPSERRRAERAALRAWRDEHPLDVVRIIARQRAAGQ